jgi:hypothetical protein
MRGGLVLPPPRGRIPVASHPVSDSLSAPSEHGDTAMNIRYRWNDLGEPEEVSGIRRREPRGGTPDRWTT